MSSNSGLPVLTHGLCRMCVTQLLLEAYIFTRSHANLTVIVVVRQFVDESIEEFAERIQELATDGYLNTPENVVDTIAVDAFLKGCIDKKAALFAMEKDPNTMDQALRYVKSSIHNQKILLGYRKPEIKRVQLYDDSECLVRQVKTGNNPNMQDLQKKYETMETRMATTEQHIWTIKSDIKTISNSISPKATADGQRSPSPRGLSPNRDVRDVQCNTCREMGHYSTQCPKKSWSPMRRNRSVSEQVGDLDETNLDSLVYCNWISESERPNMGTEQRKDQELNRLIIWLEDKKEPEEHELYLCSPSIKHLWNLGDIVFKLDSTSKVGQSKKLTAPWQGPYVVTRVLSPVLYEITGRKKEMIVHHDRIKQCDDEIVPLWIKRLRNRLFGQCVPEENIDSRKEENELPDGWSDVLFSLPYSNCDSSAVQLNMNGENSVNRDSRTVGLDLDSENVINHDSCADPLDLAKM
ncbi:unnamed protein product [Mytilus coruscus]|uniref:CCHC-type domain-containing protein n=1 Tax=Mytilus coruscus TaxID=42192 RepID=A0A6J8CYD4_MYTCO|nr:unnamed protein product [Mytilus coruscus]